MKTTEKIRINRRMLLITGCIFLCNSFFMEASTVVRGQVTDNKKQPINYATATLLNPKTREIVDGDMCDKKGKFFIENVKPGEYILSVRMLGFAKNESEKIVIDSVTNLEKEKNIVLTESAQQLSEVVVTAKRPQNKQTAAANNHVNRKNINRASTGVENNGISGLRNQLSNYLKELQSRNFDETQTIEAPTFRMEVEKFLVNRYKDMMQSGINYIQNEKH